ncbi:MAG TPA: cyclic nucleotide-binding domain-containing protein [Polyangia bacterium]|nr:cyclic nucleotide-binding domain-containing protein [Polyangia bacterium]
MTLANDDLAFLQGIAIFGGLIGDALERVASRLQHREVAAGQLLVTEGEPGREMFVIRAGAVEVFKALGPVETRLALLRAGACFGEMALIDIQPRSAGVRAVEPSTVWSLAHADLSALWKSDPQSFTMIVMNIAREISRRLRRADRLIASIHRVVAGLEPEG